MKLLLFSDLHCDAAAASQLVHRADEVDVVVGAGDFATMRRGLQAAIDSLSSIDRPTVFVPGNSESFEELAAACESWSHCHVLHGSGVEIDGISFWGVGGAIPETPFGDWSYDLSEQEGRQLLADCPMGAVIVSHSPPKGVVDRSSRGDQLGSQAVREAVELREPRLLVCGHIHESGGQTGKIGDTTVINAGPAGMTWQLG
jgi:Icc-related predicted phosphoesterase